MPVLQGLRLRMPRQRGHGHLQVRVPAPLLCQAAAPHGPLHHGLAAGPHPDPARGARCRRSHQQAAAPGPGGEAGEEARRDRTDPHHDQLRPRVPAGLVQKARQRRSGQGQDRGALAGLLQQPPGHLPGQGRGRGARGPWLQGHHPRRIRLLRTDLALDGPTRCGPQGHPPHAEGHGTAAGVRLPDHRPGALLHRDAGPRNHR